MVALEHGFRGTLTQPYLLSSGWSLQLQGASWWTSEPAYTDRSRGGRLVLTKRLSSAGAGVTRRRRSELRLSLINERDDYAIVSTALQDLTLRDQFIALGLDRPPAR